MLTRFWNWLVMAGSRISKTKIIALLAAGINLARDFSWLNWTDAQTASVNAILVAAFAISLRDGMSRGD